MISQAMLMISIAVIAPAPCRGAFAMQHLARQYREARRTRTRGQRHDQKSDDQQHDQKSDETDEAGEFTPIPTDPTEYKIQLHQEVQLSYRGELIQGIVDEVSGDKLKTYVVFTKLGFLGKIPRKDIKGARRVLGMNEHKKIQLCDREDCKNRLKIQRRVDLQIEQMQTSKTSGLCAAYELAKNAMKKNVDLFKQSKWRFKWCCFVSSCLGCFGTTVCCCAGFCYGGPDGLGDTLCKLFCCCAATSDTMEAGEAATCGFCDYICCTGGSDGGAATATTSGGDVDCGGCDCAGGDCVLQ